MKLFFRLLLVLLVLGGAGYAVWYFYLQPKPDVVPTTTAVTRGDIEIDVLATGTLNARSVVIVGAEVSGKIDALHVELGQTVKKGDLIAEIDPLDRENALKIAKASLQNVQAQRRIQVATAEEAKLTADRAEQLKSQNLMSEADYLSAKVAYENADAQIDVIDAQITSAELSVESAELNLSRTRVTAPMDGTVVALPVEVGQTINAANSSPTIVKLADLSTMIVRAGISEADVPSVRPGQRAYFTILGDPDTPIDATLLSVEPATDDYQSSDSTTATTSSSSAVYYNGVLSVPNTDGRLKISMTAQVTIVTSEAKNALLVPASAVTTGPRGGSVVEVYDPKTKTLMPRRITTGLNNKVMVEIKDGIEEGEAVVTTGAGAPPLGAAGGNSSRRGTFGAGGGLLGGGGPPPGG